MLPENTKFFFEISDFTFYFFSVVHGVDTSAKESNDDLEES